MSNYSKIFGAIIGGFVALLGEAGVSHWLFELPQFADTLAGLLGSAFGTWIAPRNA